MSGWPDHRRRRTAAARTAAALAALLAAGGSAAGPGLRGEGLLAPPGARPCALRAAPGVQMSEGFPAAPSPEYAHAAGELRALVLFIDFPDAPARKSARARFAEFFPAVRRWYARASYGRLRYRPVPVLRYFRMPHPFSSYGIERGYGWAVHKAMMRDMVRIIGRSVDFRGYDLVNVIATPNAGPPAEETVLSVTWTGGSAATSADGTPLNRVSVIYGHDEAGFRVLAHENGHILGLPDLYDVNDFARTDLLAGQWDIMSLDWGLQTDLLAWHKWRLGWLDDSQVGCVTGRSAVTREFELSPVETRGGRKAVVVPYGSSAAYVVEARRALGNDARACSQGVLIYQVHTDVETGDGPVRIENAHPGTEGCPFSSGAFNSLNEAPYRPGQRFVDRRAGVEVDVLGRDGVGGWAVRVRRSPTTGAAPGGA